jgi:hypothetical protein
MYFRDPPAISVVLMSRRPSAPYVDQLSENGQELEYEGHDAKKEGNVDPKKVDQPWQMANGRPTENARFARAAEVGGKAFRSPPRVRVYEKLRPGIWSDKGLFNLVGYSYRDQDGRKVFRFDMRLCAEPDEYLIVADGLSLTRAIPSWVKQTVFKRDKGRCVLCGESDNLHFDHDLPYSKGGTSLLPENVRLLCARHNLAKGARVQ